jgi:phage tail sheath protein FI
MSGSAFFHGITTTAVTGGARTISVPSSSVIGLVAVLPEGYAALANGVTPGKPVLITSEREAIAVGGESSPFTKACQAIYTRAKAVIVAVPLAPVVDAAALTSAVIGGVKVDGTRTGLQALIDGKSLFNAQPRLLIAPGHSATLAVATAMEAVAEKLSAIAIIDGPNTTDEAAMAYATSFGGKRLYMVDPGVMSWDTTANADVGSPASAWVAGLFAWTDTTYGFWASPSNKTFLGVTGTKRPIEFLDGDATCRANLLNNAFIATIIRDEGFRLWGNRTLSSDPKWTMVTRVRTFDMVMAALLYGTKWAVDEPITKGYVKAMLESLHGFMRDLKAKGAVINFDVFIDTERNTATELEQGRIFFGVEFTDSPPAENPTFLVDVNNKWITEVLDTRS